MIRTASQAPSQEEGRPQPPKHDFGGENPYVQRVTNESLSRLGQQWLQVLTEAPDLVRQGFVRSLPHQESTHPAHAMRRRLLSYQPRPEQELAELLERRLDLTHGPPGPTSASIGMPSPRSHGKSLTSSRLSGPRHQYPPPGPVSHRQPEPWVDVDPGKWRTQHIHGIPCLSRQRHFPGDGTSESSKLKYGLHLTDHWPPSRNSKHDIVSSAGPGRFAFSCLELALAGYTTLGSVMRTDRA